MRAERARDASRFHLLLPLAAALASSACGLASLGAPDAGASPPAASCGEGAIAAPCTCQGAARGAGYCCAGLWQAVACGPQTAPPGLLDPEVTTAWAPGILADAITRAPLGADGLPVRNTLCRAVARGEVASLQATLDGCAPGTVVELEAGTYLVPSTIRVPTGVVLRGRGSSGPGATIVALASGQSGPVLAIGPAGVYDQVCYQSSFRAAVTLAADAAKEQTGVAVPPGATGFAAGDLALVDQRDDPAIVNPGDCGGAFKRKAGYGLGQRVEIAAVESSTGSLTLSTPLHWTFRVAQGAQISRVAPAVTKWAGIEHLWLQNGINPVPPVGSSYLGRMAGGIEMHNAAYCWVKDVQTDGTITGMHVALTGTYRCVVRDSHFHNSKLYGFGEDNYGIVLRCGSADNLVENNVARYMNKPILFNASGGGNVVGYNYADNSWSIDQQGDDACQEVNIDCHCAFPHMELMEGNHAPHMGASLTHGNAGYLTYFRNYASSQFSPAPIVWSQPSVPQYCNVAALQFDRTDLAMTVIGNVLGSTTDPGLGVPASLGTATVTQAYRSYDGSPSIFALGGATDVSATSLWWHGNFDTVNGRVMWNPAISTRTLPASLYHAAKPAWWPADEAWPWVGPDRTPMVGTLPAQALSSRFDYRTPNNPDCTPSAADYNCVCR